MEELLQSASQLIQELFFFRKRHVIQKRLTKSQDRKTPGPLNKHLLEVAQLWPLAATPVALGMTEQAIPSCGLRRRLANVCEWHH
jgi:hypothetical protein